MLMAQYTCECSSPGGVPPDSMVEWLGKQTYARLDALEHLLMSGSGWDIEGK